MDKARFLSERSAGVLLPVASLPGEFGCGGFGEEAYRWIDFLAECEFTYWQILPVTYSYSHLCPYLSSSSYAKHHLYIDPQNLKGLGLLSEKDIRVPDSFSADRISPEVIAWKHTLLRAAYQAYKDGAASYLSKEFGDFVRSSFDWLYDFSLYNALTGYFDHRPWQMWPEGLRSRDPECLADWEMRLADTIEEEMFAQFLLERQWTAIWRYAHDRGIAIIGDLPVYSTKNSADVWLNQAYYNLKEDGYPAEVAGYPPYSGFPQGQVWDTPTYRWDRMATERYGWVVDRMEAQFKTVDVLRIDHYLGYFKYWSIPEGGSPVEGRWNTGPGKRLLDQVAKRELPLIVENLGKYNKETDEAVRDFGLLGMRLLQVELDLHQNFDKLLATFPERSVAYTGTHDNPPMAGWLDGLPIGKRRKVEEWLKSKVPSCVSRELIWAYLVLMSPSQLTVLPFQDLLGLGSEARINTPGTDTDSNWTWRFRWKNVPPNLSENLKKLVVESGRSRVSALRR